MANTPAEQARRRVPAAQRREELIAAAVVEFAHGGLYGTPVERIARRVGVAQPYVFSLFASKRELFLAALERGFERSKTRFGGRASEYEQGRAPGQCTDALEAMGSPTRNCWRATATTRCSSISPMRGALTRWCAPACASATRQLSSSRA